MVPALLVYLAVQCFPGCDVHALLCGSFCKLILSPLQAYLLHYSLSLDLAVEREHIMISDGLHNSWVSRR